MMRYKTRIRINKIHIVSQLNMNKVFLILTAILGTICLAELIIWIRWTILQNDLREPLKNSYRARSYIGLGKDKSEPDMSKVFIYIYAGCTMDHEWMQSSWIHTHTNMICDASYNDSEGTCFFKSASRYNYDQLGIKAGEWLKYMCDTEMYKNYQMFMKIDDDVIFPKNTFSYILKSLAPYNGSFFAGYMRSSDSYTWTQGSATIYGNNTLKNACDKNKNMLASFRKYEDLELGRFLTKGQDVHTIAFATGLYYHKTYDSNRLNIAFTPYIMC